MRSLRVGSHQTEIFDNDLSRESGVTFVSIDVCGKPCVALGQRLNRKLGKLTQAAMTDSLLPTWMLRHPMGRVKREATSAASPLPFLTFHN
jgi:hypothetical protein